MAVGLHTPNLIRRSKTCLDCRAKPNRFVASMGLVDDCGLDSESRSPTPSKLLSECRRKEIEIDGDPERGITIVGLDGSHIQILTSVHSSIEQVEFPVVIVFPAVLLQFRSCLSGFRCQIYRSHGVTLSCSHQT